jgi:tetratricopeptide (TPR) repeat protein
MKYDSEKAGKCRQRGNECFKGKKYQAAIKLYEIATNLYEPNDASDKVKCYGNICLCMLKLQQYAKAEAAANSAIKCDPTYIKGYRHRGVARFHQGTDYLGAVADLTHVSSTSTLSAKDVLLLAKAKQQSQALKAKTEGNDQGSGSDSASDGSVSGTSSEKDSETKEEVEEKEEAEEKEEKEEREGTGAAKKSVVQAWLDLLARDEEDDED